MAGALKKSGSVETETRELLTSKTINLKRAEAQRWAQRIKMYEAYLIRALDGDAFEK